MRIVDKGTGTPVVLVPGIQGRWEWMKPAVDALASRCRVITFSLADEPTCGGRFDEQSGFTCYVEQISDALDEAGLREAAICGVSFGGLVAAAFAARHSDRVSALALVSALPPSWQPDARARFFLRAPRLLSPLFCVQSLRAYREIAAASPTFTASVVTASKHGARVLTHKFSPSRMARRAQLAAEANASSSKASPLRAELDQVHVPTMVITGDPQLDRIVPVARTREYLQIWPHAREARIEGTGHLGIITKPDEFARILVPFAEEVSRADAPRRRVV